MTRHYLPRNTPGKVGVSDWDLLLIYSFKRATQLSSQSQIFGSSSHLTVYQHEIVPYGLTNPTDSMQLEWLSVCLVTVAFQTDSHSNRMCLYRPLSQRQILRVSVELISSRQTSNSLASDSSTISCNKSHYRSVYRQWKASLGNTRHQIEFSRSTFVWTWNWNYEAENRWILLRYP